MPSSLQTCACEYPKPAVISPILKAPGCPSPRKVEQIRLDSTAVFPDLGDSVAEQYHKPTRWNRLRLQVSFEVTNHSVQLGGGPLSLPASAAGQCCAHRVPPNL